MTTTTRRAILAGLAAAPVAGLPDIAEAPPAADPVLVALAEYRRARVALDAAYANTRKFSDVHEAMVREIGLAVFQGEEFLSVPMLDTKLEQMMDTDDVSPEIKAEYAAARSTLIERRPAYDAAFEKSGVREAEREEDEPFREWVEAEVAVIAAKPTTPAGAAAQLRFIADNLEELVDDSSELAPDAIRAAVAVLEREVLA